MLKIIKLIQLESSIIKVCILQHQSTLYDGLEDGLRCIKNTFEIIDAPSIRGMI